MNLDRGYRKTERKASARVWQGAVVAIAALILNGLFCHDQQRGRGPFASSRRGPRMGRSDGAVRSRIRAGHQWHVDDLATSWGFPLGSRGLTESGWLAPCSPGLGESPMRKSPVRPESLTGLTFNHGGRGGNRTSDTGIFTLVATRQCPLLAVSGHRGGATDPLRRPCSYMSGATSSPEFPAFRPMHAYRFHRPTADSQRSQ
jgi:hypothetical protein